MSLIYPTQSELEALRTLHYGTISDAEKVELLEDALVWTMTHFNTLTQPPPRLKAVIEAAAARGLTYAR